MFRIPIGFSTIFGAIGFGATLLIPLVGQLADATAPFGVSPRVWVVCSALLAALVLVGRYGQAITDSVSNVDIGWPTIAGVIGSAAALLVPAVAEFADVTKPVGVAPAFWVGVSAVLAAVVLTGRYGQAMADGLRFKRFDPVTVDARLADAPPVEPTDYRGGAAPG